MIVTSYLWEDEKMRLPVLIAIAMIAWAPATLAEDINPPGPGPAVNIPNRELKEDPTPDFKVDVELPKGVDERVPDVVPPGVKK